MDGACDYGNEKQVGEGIQRALKEGLVKREELFVVSKLWNTFHQPQHVQPAIERTLKDLQLEYLDLYIVHFPISLKYVDPEVRYPPEWIHMPDSEKENMMIPDNTVTYQQTWGAMEKLQEAGLTKAIGVSNIGVVKICDVLKYCKIKPAVLQVEMHPFLPQVNLLKFTQSLGIQVMAYSNLGSLSYVQIGLATAEQTCLMAPAVLAAAEKYKKTPAQVVLRWAIQRNTMVIPKSTKPERLAENMNIFDFEMSQEECDAITALNKNERYNDPAVYTGKFFGHFYPIYD